MPITTPVTEDSIKLVSHELLTLAHELQPYWKGSITTPSTRYTIESVTDRTMLIINLLARLTEEIQRLREIGIITRMPDATRSGFND